MTLHPSEQEKVYELLSIFIDELNVKFTTDLGPVIQQQEEEDRSEDDMTTKAKLIFVGGSHAARMAAAADRMGIDCVNLTTPGFRAHEDMIENSCHLLRDTLADPEDGVKTVIIYHLLDNNVFFETKPDGSRSLPEKSSDGKYHIVGRLEYADHNVIKGLVNAITPLLRAGGDMEKLILSPLPRYIKKCCRDKSHLVNKKDEDYASTMGESLSDMRDSMKDLIYGKKIRAFKVINTLRLLMEDEDTAAEKIKSYWSEDPVHMIPAGYEELIRELLKLVDTATYNRPVEIASGPVRGRKRRQWVSEDDTLAHRRYGSGSQKRYRGGHSHRGRGGHGESRGRGGNHGGGGSAGGRGGGGGRPFWKDGRGRGGRPYYNKRGGYGPRNNY
jgi:uncharacterized membrane protein YgcG